MELPKNELIYMASPYTHEDKKVLRHRFDEVCKVTAVLMKEGYFIFSPIAHTHPLTKYGVPGYWEYWADYDRKFLTACDALCVLMLDGWKESVGVQAEIKIAQEFEMPIFYLEHESEPYKMNKLEKLERFVKKMLSCSYVSRYHDLAADSKTMFVDQDAAKYGEILVELKKIVKGD